MIGKLFPYFLLHFHTHLNWSAEFLRLRFFSWFFTVQQNSGWIMKRHYATLTPNRLFLVSKNTSPPKTGGWKHSRTKNDDRMNSVFVFYSKIRVDTLGVPPKPWVHEKWVAIIYLSLWREPNLTFTKSTGFFHRQDPLKKIQETYAYWSFDPFGFLFGVVRCLTSPSWFECKRLLERAEFSTKEKVVVESLKF